MSSMAFIVKKKKLLSQSASVSAMKNKMLMDV
jgi:hypothetical protein